MKNDRRKITTGDYISVSSETFRTSLQIVSEIRYSIQNLLPVRLSLPDTTNTMEEASPERVYGALVFAEPDASDLPADRPYYEVPRFLNVERKMMPLHDHRTSDLARLDQRSALEKHGFAVLQHISVINSSNYDYDSWYDRHVMEQVYLPELEHMFMNVTGAKRVYTLTVTYRRRKPGEPAEEEVAEKSECEGSEKDTVPRFLGRLPKNSEAPSKAVHVDYTPTGASALVHHDSEVIAGWTKDIIEAENKAERTGGQYEGPRYGTFSVWRPLKPVHRDPLVFSDATTVASEDMVPMAFRQPGFDQEFLTTAYVLKPSPKTEQQKWYWLPKQRPDEVVIIKFTDTEAQNDGSGICAGIPHGSAQIDGTECHEVRESIEVRVLAVW